MSNHVVQQGEHMARIAARYGFARVTTLWDHPSNSKLKELRKNPDILAPGDEVYIPEREQRVETNRQTEKRHRFEADSESLHLRLKVVGFDTRPVAGTPCTLRLEGNSFETGTDTSGFIDREITRTDEVGELTIRSVKQGANIHVPILIGHLDPIDLPRGQQARLNNLGYFIGELGQEVDPAALDSAVQEFQCDEGLKVDGVCGPATKKKLVEVHGC